MEGTAGSGLVESSDEAGSWKASQEVEAVESHDEAVETDRTRTSSEELTEGEATRKGSGTDHSPSRRKQTSGSAETTGFESPERVVASANASSGLLSLSRYAAAAQGGTSTMWLWLIPSAT